MKNKKVVSVLLAAMLFGGVLMLRAFAKSGDFTIQTEVTFGQTEARSMLPLINELRKPANAWCWDQNDQTKLTASGLKDLVYDYELEKIAMQRAAEIAVYYSHTRPNNERCFTAYTYSPMASGENIAWGYNAFLTAEEVFVGWSEADEPYSGQGHRRNMLDGDFAGIGIGHVVLGDYHFWVQEFGAPLSRTAKTAPLDGVSRMTVVCNTALVSPEWKLSPETPITLSSGDTVALPAASSLISLPHGFGALPAQLVSPSFTVTPASVAVIENGKLKGVSPGTAELKLTGSAAAAVKVTVKESEHRWDNGRITTPATCVKDGVMTYTCTVCKETKTEPVKASGHKPVADAGVAATCTVDGRGEGSHCSVCGEVLTAQPVIKAEGHRWNGGEITVPATCTVNGVMTYTCTVCGESKSSPYKALGHHPVADEAVAPGCETDGKTEGSHCSVCGEILTPQAVVKATGHRWDDGRITAPASCLKDCVKTYTCTVCGKTRTETLSAPGSHSFGKWIVTKEATAAEEGEETRVCTVCGEQETRLIPRLPAEQEPPANAKGDVDNDGKITAADARLALRASVGLQEAGDVAKGSAGYLAADVNGDGKVASDDARLILRASVGLEDASRWGD